MSDELKACPFCGAPMVVYHARFLVRTTMTSCYVTCTGGMCCPICPRTAWCKNAEQAINVWHTATRQHGETLSKLRVSHEHSENINKRLFDFLEQKSPELYEEFHKSIYDESKRKGGK